MNRGDCLEVWPSRALRFKRVAAGFTWLEALILMLAFAILVTLVSTRFAGAVGPAQTEAFAAELAEHLRGVEGFYRDTGEYPRAAGAGKLPVGFEPYVNATAWESVTPIGGYWDVELGTYGVTSALGVRFTAVSPAPSLEVLESVDRLVDDGDLAGGKFRRLGADRFYFVVME